MKTYTFRIESSYYVETTVTLGENEDVDEAFDEWMHVVENRNLYCNTFSDRTFEIHERHRNRRNVSARNRDPVRGGAGEASASSVPLRQHTPHTQVCAAVLDQRDDLHRARK